MNGWQPERQAYAWQQAGKPLTAEQREAARVVQPEQASDPLAGWLVIPDDPITA